MTQQQQQQQQQGGDSARWAGLPFRLRSLQGVWFLSTCGVVAFSLLHFLFLFSPWCFNRALVSAIVSYSAVLWATARTRPSGQTLAQFLSTDDNLWYLLYALAVLTAPKPCVSFGIVPLAIYAAWRLCPILKGHPLFGRFVERFEGLGETRLSLAIVGEFASVAWSVLAVFVVPGSKISRATSAWMLYSWFKRRCSVSQTTRQVSCRILTPADRFLSLHVPFLLGVFRRVTDPLTSGLHHHVPAPQPPQDHPVN